MKNNRFKYIFIFLVLLATTSFFALKQINKEHVNVEKTTPNMIIAVAQILSDYQNNEAAANTKFTDKVIQLKGVISEISTHDGNATITLSHPNFDTTVICSFQPKENLSVLKYKKGDKISLKGICTGYLLDVVLVNCVIIK
ncbi:MAG: hypothetical protein QM478_13190 [Flavobacteriaceae bacterium]